MEEDFVTYEIAVKLKEKGFKDLCLAYYTNTNDLYFNYSHKAGAKYSDCYLSHNLMPKDSVSGKFVDAPTISQVLKWLRKKKLHIELWTVGKKPIKWCHTITTLNHVGEKQGWSSGTREDSYEAAAIAGIHYVIDNLI